MAVLMLREFSTAWKNRKRSRLMKQVDFTNNAVKAFLKKTEIATFFLNKRRCQVLTAEILVISVKKRSLFSMYSNWQDTRLGALLQRISHRHDRSQGNSLAVFRKVTFQVTSSRIFCHVSIVWSLWSFLTARAPASASHHADCSRR